MHGELLTKVAEQGAFHKRKSKGVIKQINDGDDVHSSHNIVYEKDTNKLSPGWKKRFFIVNSL